MLPHAHEHGLRVHEWHARVQWAWAWAACVRACDVRAPALRRRSGMCVAQRRCAHRLSHTVHVDSSRATTVRARFRALAAQDPPPSILRLHAPRRAPSSPESSPWSAAEHPGRQRLLGACLAGFFAGALLTLLRRTQRRGVGTGVRPKPREADAPQRAHALGCRRCTVHPQRAVVQAGADAVARHTQRWTSVKGR